MGWGGGDRPIIQTSTSDQKQTNAPPLAPRMTSATAVASAGEAAQFVHNKMVFEMCSSNAAAASPDMWRRLESSDSPDDVVALVVEVNNDGFTVEFAEVMASLPGSTAADILCKLLDLAEDLSVQEAVRQSCRAQVRVH